MTLKLQFLDATSSKVQEWMWERMDPAVFRWDYTRLQAINYMVQACVAGEMQLVGDLAAGFVVIAQEQNPKIVTLHIVGNGILLRTAIKQGTLMAALHGYDYLSVTTTFKSISRICQRMGFELVATVPRWHMIGGELVDCYMLSLEIKSPHGLLTADD